MRRMWLIAATVSFAVLFLNSCGVAAPGDNGNFSVNSSTPSSGSDEVSPSQTIQVNFSQALDKTSLNAYTFQVMESEGMSLIEGKVHYQEGSTTVSFQPYMPLPYDTPVHVMVSTMVRSSSGAHLSNVHNINFHTQTSPSESVFNPQDNATNVSPRSTIRVQFGDGVEMSTVSSFSVTLKETQTGQNVDIELGVDEDSQTAILYVADTYNFGQGLKPQTQYTYTVLSTVLNGSSAPFFGTDRSTSFTTAGATPFTNFIATDWDEYADAIAVSSDGTIIIAGETWGALTDTVSHYDGDGFIAAIDAFSGEVKDLVQFGSGADSNENLDIADPVYDMTMIGSDIYVTGFTRGNLSTSDFSSGQRALFVARYQWNGASLTPMGTPQILRGSGDMEGYAITSDANTQSVYVIGTVTGALNGEVGKGQEDVVVAKYSADLSLAWSKQYGTAARDFGRGIAVGLNGVYIAGDTLGNFATPASEHVGLNPFLLKLNAADGSVATETFDTSSQTANPGQAHDRMVTGVTTFNSRVYVIGTQHNNNGISTYALRFDESGGTPTYLAHGDNTPDQDEVATGIYSNTSGVYVATTRFHQMNNGSGAQMHGMTEIMSLTDSGFSVFKNLDAEMHASVRDMVISGSGTMYATGYVHGSMSGMMPHGMGDAFVVQP
ncbi:MAG: Ig-like domain-containing protein [Gammaproteobacteria bacterium]|nr:Ig-like domain-containing protein [Gammaproteobacteria bacterium]